MWRDVWVRWDVEGCMGGWDVEGCMGEVGCGGMYG